MGLGRGGRAGRHAAPQPVVERTHRQHVPRQARGRCAAGRQGCTVAILSATATSTNQNTWIAEMKKAALRNIRGSNLVTTVYGDDLSRQELPRDPRAAADPSGSEGDHRPDLGRHRGRRPGREGCRQDRPGVRDRASGCPSEMAGAVHSGATKILRDLEPDRPRLLGRLPGRRPRQGRKARGWCGAADRPHGQVQARRRHSRAPWPIPFIYDKLERGRIRQGVLRPQPSRSRGAGAGRRAPIGSLAPCPPS